LETLKLSKLGCAAVIHTYILFGKHLGLLAISVFQWQMLGDRAKPALNEWLLIYVFMLLTQPVRVVTGLFIPPLPCKVSR